MSVDGNNPEYGVQVPVLVHPVADVHLFNLIGAFWYLQNVRSCLIDEVVCLEETKQAAVGTDVAEASGPPIRDTETMLTAAKDLTDHLATILMAFLGPDAFASGEFLSWYCTVTETLDNRGGGRDAAQ